MWQRIAPLLDGALEKLGTRDRDAIVLRFFENKSLAEVGAATGSSEDAAKMRVNRALEKLRKMFIKRGVTFSALAIAGAVAANSVSAAPVGLAATITATAIKGTVISATLVKGTMKTMTWLKLKFAIGVSVATLIVGGAATVAISQTSSSDKLTPQEIIKQSQDAYAALTSYSDEGITVSSVGSTVVDPHTFSIRLARPNLYWIEWKQDGRFFTTTGLVWSAGSGDYLNATYNNKPTKYSNREQALSSATGVSGGAAGSIPGTFFKMNWGNKLSAAMQSAIRKPDNKCGGVDCYVLSQSKDGRTQTLWIGKEDLLIRQVESETSAAVLKAMFETEAKKHPEIKAMLQRGNASGDSKSVETHTNIVMNPVLTKADFVP